MENILSVVPHNNDALDHIVGAVSFDVGQERSKPRGSVEKGEHDRNLMIYRIKQSLVALKAVPVVGSVVQGAWLRTCEVTYRSIHSRPRAAAWT